ncbi:MAG: hypothetical protein ACYC9Q_15210 [Bacillota bacterium]
MMAKARRTKKKSDPRPPYRLIEEYRERTRREELALVAETHDEAVLLGSLLQLLIERSHEGAASFLAAAEEVGLKLHDLIGGLAHVEDELLRLFAGPIWDRYEPARPSLEDLERPGDFTYGVGYVEEPRRILRLELPDTPPRLPYKWAAHQSYKNIRDRCYRPIHTTLRLARECDLPLPKEPFKSAVVVVVSHFGHRQRRDVDNYMFKFLIDGLMLEGLLLDDSYEHVPYIVAGAGPDKPVRTELIVVEADSGASLEQVVAQLPRPDLFRFTWDKGKEKWALRRPGGSETEWIDVAKMGNRPAPWAPPEPEKRPEEIRPPKTDEDADTIPF